MKKVLITLVSILVLAAIAYAGYRIIQNRRQASTISSLQTVTVQRGDLTATVGATGTVRPEQSASLLWQTSGIVDNVYPEVGQVISAGETLATLAASSLPQNVILAQSDLITARNALNALTNPDFSIVSAAEKALAAAHANYQQAINNLANTVITNQDANDDAHYNDWLAAKTSLDAARNDLPLANASIDIQAYFQAVREGSRLEEELKGTQANLAAQPGDTLLAQKVSALETSLQDNLSRQNSLQTGLPADTVGLVKTLSAGLSTYETATDDFIATVITDTLYTNVDTAQVQADLAQKQSSLLNLQSTLTDQVNHRATMNGKRCDDETISDYQDAYDKALNLYNFTGHILNSKEYQLLQTATANLNWCTSVWSDTDIAEQDAKISSTQAQIQLVQAQISADQSQISDVTNSVYGLAVYLNNVWTAYQDASQQLNNAVTTLYELERTPNPDDLAAAQARVQAAQTTAGYQSLTAPFAGTVTEVNVKPGDQVTPGMSAFRVDNLARLLVDVSVSEVDINSIKPGQPVTLSFDAIRDKQYNGTVSEVASVGDIVQGAVNFVVTVELKDADANVRPGMTAAVNIIVNQISDALLVPNRAVRLVNGQQVVYLLNNGQLEKVEIALGASSGSQSEVTAGALQAGDQVVLNPPQDLFEMGGPFGG